MVDARDRAPRQCGGDHIPSPIIGRGNKSAVAVSSRTSTGRYGFRTGCARLPQKRIC
jgi:hypothetical protein